MPTNVLTPPSLVAAPREVPASTALGLRVLSARFQSACALLCLTFATIAFVANNEVRDWPQFAGQLESVTGHVTNVARTGESDDIWEFDLDFPIRRYDYEFDLGGQRYAGHSFSSVHSLAVGAVCDVEYAASAPEHSRIRGTRSRTFGAWTLGILLFPIWGAVWLVLSQAGASKELRLRRVGRLTTGRLVETKVVHDDGEGPPLRRATVEFELDNGAKQRVVLHSRRRLVLESRRGVQLLYDPSRPSLARAFDDLAVGIGLDSRGRVKPMRWSRVSLGLWLPSLALIVLLATAYELVVH